MNESDTANFLDFADENITAEEVGSEPVHPSMQWVNGTPKLKNLGNKDIAFTGGFFISKDQVDEEAPPGFSPYTLNTDSGDSIEGYSCQILPSLVILGVRRCWNVRANSDNPIRFANSEYETADLMATKLIEKGEKDVNPRGRSHVQIRFVKDELAQPYVISIGGTNASLFASRSYRKPGIIGRFQQKVVKTANVKRNAAARKAKRAAPKPLVTCLFQLDGLSYARKTAGKKDPLFAEVGSTTKTTISQPSWINEPEGNASVEIIQNLFLGADLELSNDLQAAYTEASDWCRAWSEDVLSARREARKQSIAHLLPELAIASGQPASGMPSGNEMSF